MTALLFDGLLALVLLGLAWRVVASPNVFQAIMVFVVFGLIMALVWTRLHAPDLALAEAAIGAGITGALLFGAWQATRTGESRKIDSRRTPGSVLPIILPLIIGAMLAIAWSAANLPPPALPTGSEALARLEHTGVGNPVTAVLLNYRGYDTLLEMAVLLLALLGVWTVADRERQWYAHAGDEPGAIPMLGALLSVLVPLIVLVAGYLLWAGSQRPGGAFQAGALLAAGGVLLCLSGRLMPLTATPLAQRALLLLGLVVFCLTGLGVMAAGWPALTLPPALATGLIYLIESALMVSIALTLVLLFADARGLRRSRS